MAAEQRRVISDWRALLLLRRATQRIPADARRWESAPGRLEEIHAILKRLVQNGDLGPIKGLSRIYEAKSPFVQAGGVQEEEILMELHPYAALSHVTALVFHGMTEEFPKEIHALLPSGHTGGMLPPGTREGDWEGLWLGLSLVRGRMVDKIKETPIHWHALSRGTALIGTAEYRPNGYPVRVTTPERTLVDGLLHPEWCGGIGPVLDAWARTRDTLDVNPLVELVEQFNVAILKQRVGFILEQLGMTHPLVDQWPAQAKRGGSSKLFGGAPFKPDFSERWKLSINVPIDVLQGATE
ncbi:uncharacterized protein STAUR_8220 [Stigmatella aurantiaca DW4/3-1]|uniref:AbiEi antitoxin C-terminal domain-containing protein n=2 Tax=Stigmatella aurantiaca TaxID=41 RepID=Q093J2_STIAD|nr:uncharacterized protein STAUR_8220 [Stigmatella aurantiaca DW4/3-1]EAU66884.1 conserved hypothetical protein [Stigmatella aurantiaca DW4/3-1]